MKYIPLTFLLLFLPMHSAVGATVDLSHADLTPFLRIVETTVITSIVAPGITITEDRDLFIARSGAATLVQVDFAAGVGGVGYRTALVRAINSKNSIDTLSQALAKNRVGFQSDCQSRGLNGRIDLYWYGKGGRRNVFSIKLSTVDTPPDPVLPQCSAEALDILATVTDFYSLLIGLPGAEVIIYPPPPGPTK